MNTHRRSHAGGRSIHQDRVGGVQGEIIWSIVIYLPSYKIASI